MSRPAMHIALLLCTILHCAFLLCVRLKILLEYFAPNTMYMHLIVFSRHQYIILVTVMA